LYNFVEHVGHENSLKCVGFCAVVAVVCGGERKF